MIFDDEKSYELCIYNIETVMAEKIETILRRTVFNTRPRDFYDVYILATTQKFDKAVFAEAMKATADHRRTTERIPDVPGIMQNIEESPELRAMWGKYRKQFVYAADIEYEQIIHPVSSTGMFGGSLYQAEEDMNNLEQDLVMELTALPNVRWWHRNIARHGFAINGFIKHYPDIMIITQSGKIIFAETKGNHLKNDDSRDKILLGQA